MPTQRFISEQSLCDLAEQNLYTLAKDVIVWLLFRKAGLPFATTRNMPDTIGG